MGELTGLWGYGNVINTVFDGWENQLDNGGSYDDVQWVAIAYIQAGRHNEAKHYYDVASQGLDSSYCGGGGTFSRTVSLTHLKYPFCSILEQR